MARHTIQVGSLATLGIEREYRKGYQPGDIITVTRYGIPIYEFLVTGIYTTKTQAVFMDGWPPKVEFEDED